MKLPFHIPYVAGEEETYIQQAIEQGKGVSNGYFTQRCENWLESFTGTSRALLTPSCTAALELCALLLDIKPGDEIILPSFTYVSAANAFVLRGAKIVFVDLNPVTMNVDSTAILKALSPNTRAVVVMHYGGVACELDSLLPVLQERNIFLIEDAAHCIDAYTVDKHLGTLGDLGVLSFHHTKNVHCGEGGALLIQNQNLIDRAYVLRDKGTNRRAFFQGKVDEYSWIDLGSSYSISEISAAFLWAQLQEVSWVSKARRQLFADYRALFNRLERWSHSGSITDEQTNGVNGHLFFIKCDDPAQRNVMLEDLQKQGIDCRFHYVPLHSSPAGRRFSITRGSIEQTKIESEKLLRLPIYPGLSLEDEYCLKLIDTIKRYV